MRPRRLLAPVVAVLLAASVLSCRSQDATSPARYGLFVDMRAMAPHVGQLLELRVVHRPTQIEVGYAAVDPIVAVNFVVSVPDILIAGEPYDVDFYADLNRNGHYDAPPTDHAWRRPIAPGAGDVMLTFTHDTAWTDIDFPPRG